MLHLPPASTRPRRLRALASVGVLVAVASVLAACGATATPGPATPSASIGAVTSPSASATPSAPPAVTPAATPMEQGPPTVGPSPTPGASASIGPTPTPLDPMALFRTIGEQTARVRQLDWKEPIEPRLIDEAELRRMMEKDLDAETPAEVIARTEALYRGLGMMTGDRSLRDLYLDAMGAQVLGFYRDTDRTLYVVKRSGDIGPIEEFTVSHELTHALQDQNFGLGNLRLDEPDQGDRALATRALVEGDATLASFQWMQGNLTFKDLSDIVKAGLDPAPQAALDALPPIARIALTFPYENGLAWVMGLQQKGGWEAVDAAWKDPPASTEQILHPGKYAAGEKPVEVALPAGLAKRMGAGWRLTMEDTFGELGLRTWLAQVGAPAAADAAAAGWGGDRVGLYEGPGGAWAIVIRTAWDDEAAAQRFAPAAAVVAASLPHATVGFDADGPVVLVGSDASIVKKLRSLVIGG